MPVEVDQAALLEAVAYATKLHLRLAVGKNHLGFVSDKVREGDPVCLLRDCSFPFVVRPEGDGYRYVCDGVFLPDAASAVAQERWERRRDSKVYREFLCGYGSRSPKQTDQQWTTIVIC